MLIKPSAIFQEKFHRTNHQYPTNHWQYNFFIPSKPLKSSGFAISSSGPYFWNRCATKFKKEISSFLQFLSEVFRQCPHNFAHNIFKISFRNIAFDSLLPYVYCGSFRRKLADLITRANWLVSLLTVRIREGQGLIGALETNISKEFSWFYIAFVWQFCGISA